MTDSTATLLHSTTDAAVWASEFCRLFPVMDEGTMVGWFANAIETGRAAGERNRRVDCANCGSPAVEHCRVHLIPCCPGRCPA